MSVLPPRPDLDHLRRQAADLLRSARAGDEPALARIRAVSDRVILASAQLALAREYGFANWARLKTEVQRRDVLDRRDVAALTAMLAVDPNLAVDRLQRWVDHPLGASPLGYVTMLRFDTATDTWRDVDGTVEVARVLLSAIAASGGEPADLAGALINAASYGDAAVAQLLVEAGADLEARAALDSGGVPGGTALLHAAVFGMTAVVDVLVRAGAAVPDVVLAAAAGDLSRHPVGQASEQDRVLALMMAADHQRLPVIDALGAAGTPVDAVDPVWGRHPLRLAAENGRPASVRRLLELGADPSLRDGRGRDPLDLCRAGRRQHPDDPGYPQTETILLAATTGR